uniref:DNA-directed RNA polymerase n=1 Tax=Clavaria fumosa TaxID=264083 RepID=A0A7T3U4U0_9AGAR|nr:DNA-dependent RNA polymerase [Clavaria fumosa]QPZ51159.1 DNA-dependent RNA polymerase [Clavaria fumosa]
MKNVKNIENIIIRGIHKTSNNLSKDINNNNSYLISYLDSIKEIINNTSYTQIQKQKIIEESWVDITKEKLEDPKYLLDRYSNKLYSIIKNEAFLTLMTLYENNIIKKKFPLFSEDLHKLEYLILTYSIIITNYSKLKLAALSILIGENILYLIYKNKLKAKKDFITYVDWKKELNINSNDNITIKLGYFFVNILTKFPHEIIYIKYVKEHNTEYYKVKINEEYLSIIKENIIISPTSLPMVCKPIEWSCKSFGGFLENKNRGENIITGSTKYDQKMENKKNLYNAINYLNSIKFSINSLLLNYLKTEEGKYFLDKIKAEDNLQRIITLKVSETFSNSFFYLNVHADWRGRIYTHSFFINYQGDDLSSSLLNFWDGELLTETGKYYLYIYGANNHNENNISKSSFSDRINWVKNNYNKIISLDKELILSADNPFIFLSFCLNVKELHKNPNTIIKIPVFLDATCNGIQHLAAIMQDIELGTKVNLIPYESEDKPRDIYFELIDPINKAINKFGKENDEYNTLSLVKLNRKIIKQSIMTKVYNVSVYGISQQIQNKLEKIKDENSTVTTNITKDLKNNLKKINETFFICPGKNNVNVYLTYQDIYQIASILNDQIFVVFPSLNKIYDYFIKITELIIELGIPLTWITPAGIKITQKYLKSNKKLIPIKFLGKTKTLVLRQWTNILNKQKQKNSIIPNIIHSLDASHLINLINNATKDKFYPIITIHDCFGSHPNKMALLEYIVKKEFILLYTNEKFLSKFHKRLIQSIKDNNFSIIKKDKKNYVICNNDYLIIPKIPKIGKLDLEKIIQSKYMIN